MPNRIPSPESALFLANHGCSVRAIADAVKVSPWAITKCLRRLDQEIPSQQSKYLRKRGVATIAPGTIVAFPSNRASRIIKDRVVANHGFVKVGNTSCLLLQLERKGKRAININTIVNLGQ